MSEAREERLQKTLAEIARAGPRGAGISAICNWGVREFHYSRQTIRWYVSDLRTRGWIRTPKRRAHLTAEGHAEHRQHLECLRDLGRQIVYTPQEGLL
jgi:hypothetical protein